MKTNQIKTAAIEIIVFIVLLVSYPYIINACHRFFQENINGEHMSDFRSGTLLSCVISVLFAILTLLGIFLIKRISEKDQVGLFIILILLVLDIVVPILYLIFMGVIEVSVIVEWLVAADCDRTFFTTLMIWLVIDIIYLVKFRYAENSDKALKEKELK